MTTYICWIIVLSIITNALRGLHQSQVMCKPTDKQHRQIVWDRHDEIDNYNFGADYSQYVMSGVDFIRQFNLGARGHIWYRWYHAIDAGSFMAFAGLVWMLSHAGSWAPFGLALTVMWVAYEPMYQYGRYKTIFDTAYKEHVCFFDLIDFHASKWTMTAVRMALVAIMVALTIGG